MSGIDHEAQKAAQAAVAGLERAWKLGTAPDLAPLLPAVGDPMRRRVLIELIKADQRQRSRASRPKKVEEYLSEWPELQAQTEMVMELLVSECLVKGGLGPAASPGRAFPMHSASDAVRARNEHIQRDPVCGPLFRKAAAEQRQLTIDMLADEPAGGRVVSFQKGTLQTLITGLPAAPVGAVDCGPGCAHCCRLRVEVHAYEALAIAAFLRQQRTPEQLASLTDALRDRARQVRKYTPDEHVKAGLKCLFLDEQDRCTIHQRRPVLCVGLTSRSRADCKAAFLDHSDTTRVAVHLPVMACAQGAASGAAGAMRELGLESGYHELNAAVLTALEHPEAAQRWLRGENVFAGPGSAAQPATALQARSAPPGRNAPCPCGSGKKFKQCCLRKGTRG